MSQRDSPITPTSSDLIFRRKNHDAVKVDTSHFLGIIWCGVIRVQLKPSKKVRAVRKQIPLSTHIEVESFLSLNVVC